MLLRPFLQWQNANHITLNMMLVSSKDIEADISFTKTGYYPVFLNENGSEKVRRHLSPFSCRKMG